MKRSKVGREKGTGVAPATPALPAEKHSEEEAWAGQCWRYLEARNKNAEKPKPWEFMAAGLFFGFCLGWATCFSLWVLEVLPL